MLLILLNNCNGLINGDGDAQNKYEVVNEINSQNINEEDATTNTTIVGAENTIEESEQVEGILVLVILINLVQEFTQILQL